MVLGDNSTAFVTDGATVTALRVPGLQVLWDYASAGGALSFVAATAGGGVVINDSQQGAIQLDANGNASSPMASLQGSEPFSLGLPMFASLDGSFLGFWANLSSGATAMTADTFLDPSDSAYPGPQASGVNKRAGVPKTNITVHFKTKSYADKLTFHPPACSQNLGLQNCPQYNFWGWNAEIAANVTDDASKWKAKQSATAYGKGKWRDSQGTLHDFTENYVAPNDDPYPENTQQPRGQALIFWIDDPGRLNWYTLPGQTTQHPVDSVTSVQNFVSSICNNANVCKRVEWSLKLVVDPGAILDSQQSRAKLGPASTNF
jgi:hypothetical protein